MLNSSKLKIISICGLKILDKNKVKVQGISGSLGRKEWVAKL
jgi:hypothetical protein